jgi:WD40 repeat protein
MDNKLWEISPDGSGLHPLLPGWRPSSWQCCGHWTPDGKFYFFLLWDAPSSTYPNQAPLQFWVLDERRGLFRRSPAEPIQLSSGPISWDTPIPSKDGKKIFARGVILHGELVGYDARSHLLQPRLGGISAEDVAFSRDGRSVAYVTFPDGTLWKANRDGTDPVQLIGAPWYPNVPRWSPDGSQIAFDAFDAQGLLRSYILSSQGGSPHSILPEDKEFESDPNWSPDGKKIVFASGQFRTSTQNFHILDLANKQVTILPGSAGMYSPRWSPNGRFIAALDTRTWALTLFDFRTQRWSVLQKEPTGYPTWSHDGQFLYFLRVADDRGVYRMRTPGGTAERVVDLNGFRFTSTREFWMGLDPEDAPWLLRDTGTDDIFALTLENR